MQPHLEIFRNSTEATSRPSFKSDCEISVINFHQFVGKTVLVESDRVRCQVRKPDGKLCGKVHGDGWVAVNKQGDEGFIGGHCAKRDFKASTDFNLKLRKATAEYEVLQYMEILEVQLADRSEYERRANALHDKLDDLQYRVKGARDSLDKRILDNLRDRQKTGNNLVSIQYLYVEKDKDGKETHDWQLQQIGALRGLGIVDRYTIYGPLQGAKELLGCLDEIVIERSAGKANLRRWSETLGRLGELEDAATNADRQFKNFMSPDNLNLLLLIESNDAVRMDTARYILRRMSNVVVTGGHARDHIKTLESELRAANQGRDIRIP